MKSPPIGGLFSFLHGPHPASAAMKGVARVFSRSREKVREARMRVVFLRPYMRVRVIVIVMSPSSLGCAIDASRAARSDAAAAGAPYE